MLKKLEYICLIGSLGLIGADRIDLLGGYGFFRLSPFLVFSSLVLLVRLLFAGWWGRLQISIGPPVRRQIPFLAVFALFLLVSFTSTIFGMDPQRGLVALCGLVLVSVLGYCISVRILEDPDPEKLVVRSVTFGLIVWLIFCVGECIAFSYGLIRLQEEASSSITSTFAPTSTLFWVPRLSGFCLDANRAGFILVMYLALLDRFASKTRYTRFLRFAIAFFILVTLSRSAMLCWFAYYLFSTGFWKRLASRRVALRVATLVIICSLVGLVYREEINGLVEVLQVSDLVSSRLSGEQGTSGGNHIELIQRGLDVWLRSTHTVVAGIGFAGSPRFLGDFFGDNKYGNFHSLYVSILAELGLPAFLLFMILLGYPIFTRKGSASCIAAIAIFNVALQSYTEPIFWLALALVWSFEPKVLRLRNLPSGDAAPL
jgi:O-antigen ligase/polysaccharide polymerase Wzy-like membrane protein